MDLMYKKKLLNKTKKLMPVEEVMKSKTIIIFYFGASWCTCSDGAIVLQKLKELYKVSV